MLARTFLLFVAAACAEILGCWLPLQWLVHRRSPLLLVPAAASLAAFVWLLSLHASASGRTYAAYGGIYIVVAIAWLRIADHESWRATDLVGALLILAGVAVISARA